METVVKRFYELTLDELYEILALRASVFVVEQQWTCLDVDGRDKEAYHVFLRDEEGIAAALTDESVTQAAKTSSLIWILPGQPSAGKRSLSATPT